MSWNMIQVDEGWLLEILNDLLTVQTAGEAIKHLWGPYLENDLRFQFQSDESYIHVRPSVPILVCSTYFNHPRTDVGVTTFWSLF